MSENLDSEQRARLWEYRLHVEDQVYSRMTVFLTYETILTGVVGLLYINKPEPPRTLLTILIVLGMLITLTWLYVQHNIKQVLEILDTRACDNFPEHKETMDRIVSGRKVVSRLTKRMKGPALQLITYVVPILILLVWIILLLIQLQ
jgi:hypothetical protein